VKSVKAVVDAARVVARAHLELRRAHREGASDKTRGAKNRALRGALDKLVRACLDLDADLAKAPPKAAPAGKPFDWTGFLRATKAGLELLKVARDPATTPGTMRAAAEDFIEGEIID